MSSKPLKVRVPITELPTLVEKKSKKMDLIDTPEPMSLPINDLPYYYLGPFKNYVDKIMTFLTTCPPFDDIFYLIAVNKNSTFVDYLVPTPLLL